jgi:YbbR domain-containing protein
MLRKLFLTNVGWKLMSLALAILIWLIVKGISSDNNTQTERTFLDLPAQIVSSTTDPRSFQISPGVVQVTVKGRPDLIKALTAREVRVRVDVSDAELTRNFRQRVEVSTPTRITIAKVEPAEVEVVVPPRPATTAPPTQP